MAKRSDLFDPSDPDRLPVQRQTEVAAVLAAGVIRMREKRRAPPASRASRGRIHVGISPRHDAAACLPEIPPESACCSGCFGPSHCRQCFFNLASDEPAARRRVPRCSE